MTDNKCTTDQKRYASDGLNEFWKARAEKNGVIYREGDSPNTIASRIREKKKNAEKQEDEKTEIQELRELALELLARIVVLEGD